MHKGRGNSAGPTWEINLKSVQLILKLLFQRTSLMENAKMTPILGEIMNDGITGR